MKPPVVLVMAKAPVPGQVKTRLAADLGDHAAATLASAALQDTLDVCEEAFGAKRCVLALAGDLAAAVDGDLLERRLSTWTVHPQRGNGFAERLVEAHRDASSQGASVIQIGMDTPQLSAPDLLAVADLLTGGPGEGWPGEGWPGEGWPGEGWSGDSWSDGHDAVLGPADDGGWWVLAVRDPRWAEPLTTVTMSTTQTCADTVQALASAGATVALAHRLRDVDTVEDAAVVAELAATARPGSSFAHAWAALR